MTSPDDALAVANFREYLQIPSVQPNIDYGSTFIYITINMRKTKNN